MTSVSSFGNAGITLQFALDRDIDAAAQDVQAAMNAASGVLPNDMPNPPTYSKVNPADTPDPHAADHLGHPAAGKSQRPGRHRAGAKAERGHRRRAGHHRRQPEARRARAGQPGALAAQGISLEDVRTALIANNVNAPKGSFDGPRQSYAISANDQIFSAAGLSRNVIVAYTQRLAGARSATSATSLTTSKTSAWRGWVDGKPAVILDIQRQPGANIIETADRVKALLPRLRASIPPSVKVAILTDRTRDHPRLGRGRAVHPGADGGAGGDGDLRLPAEILGHGDPQRGAAARASSARSAS